ncbi:MAG: hypothetical protein ACXVHT_06240 [Methanobacterium sp.]
MLIYFLFDLFKPTRTAKIAITINDKGIPVFCIPIVFPLAGSNITVTDAVEELLVPIEGLSDAECT